MILLLIHFDSIILLVLNLYYVVNQTRKEVIPITIVKSSSTKFLAVHKLKMLDYLAPFVYSRNEPVIAIVTKPTLATIPVDPHIITKEVDDGVELEKMIKLGDIDLEEVLKFGSLCFVPSLKLSYLLVYLQPTLLLINQVSCWCWHPQK